MENPTLTFVTPTLLAGDRSLASVVAHEIAHSWTGNLVTNATWNHFWLNEGFTVFLERKILSNMFGEKTRHFEILQGNSDLKSSVELFGREHEATKLVVQYDEATDPDDFFSSVPYEKGSQLLFYLETIVGMEAFERFLFSYLNTYKNKVLTTEDFLDFFRKYFADDISEIEKKVDWNAWLHTPGMPPVDVTKLLDTSLADTCTSLADKWTKSSSFESFSHQDVKEWTAAQLGLFLDTLLDNEKPLSTEAIEALEKNYKFSSFKNCEIRFSWYKLCLKAKYEKIFDSVVSMLKEQGRMKYTRPLYRSLAACSENGKDLAVKTFGEYRQNYHNICSKMVAKDLSLN